VRFRPAEFAYYVEHACSGGLAAVRGHDALLCKVRSEGLDARIETRADQRAVRAEHQSCRQATAIGDTSGREHWRRRHGIDYCGNQWQRGAARAMAARLATLGDDDVGACLMRNPRALEVLHLANQLATGRLDEAGVRPRIAKREHHGMRLVLERQLDKAAIYGPGNEAHAPRLPCLFLHTREL